ncbi:N-acetylmuramic acid 6-phosphate etherase [Spiroplasma melliferum]|uniref:N-acetylmuramic acid 6-phosphate etherase n=2 Tax=Spiroplasma melliferum TaxID=2134 RepID=A0AAI9X120_SPIME|nr:N-acetylmuramic acid 6-phosphate etherase [Spiroplasma melliferum]ELL44950.1 N-acetylmuramic acid 6-phosphate etherase [Spiroplasma melliferum IPMB4A]KAI92589.1 N-acetylmuramic acid-6-phosphate etherase [Spiroplasma melliferum KC3]QCO24179.1 N-acetylmuramic acid 6-phosphate etherase [Spiroplasma melliferum]
MNKINLSKIDTEQRNPNSTHIDQTDTKGILTIINNEDAKIAQAVQAKIPVITKVIDLIFPRFNQGGRLIYMGAGSSGRIGILDASEMLPTYGLDADRIVGIIAGGDSAIRTPAEGAEDDQDLAVNDLKKLNLQPLLDTVIGIGASGRTPYVLAGLKYAKTIGALSVGLCMTKNSEMIAIADEVIAIETGPEVITGSTRMKAGTATKLVCNMISTTLMVKLGKVYQNLMVDLVATNEKLKVRTAEIVKAVTNASDEVIAQALTAANYACKNAIVMILKNVSYVESQTLLTKYDNLVSKIINE